MKLASKIFLLLLVVVVLISTVAGMLSIEAAYADLQQRQQALARQLASEMQDRLAAAWQQQGLIGVTEALRQWAYESDQPVSVHWVVFSEKAASELRPRAPRSNWSLLSRGQIFSVVAVGADGSRALHTYLPMSGIGGEINAIELTQPLAALDQQMRQMVLGTLVTIGVTALIGLGIAYVAGIRWVAKPLQALIQHTERIGQGQFAEPLHLKGGDELNQVAQALNAMSRQLAQQQATIAHETEERLRTVEQLRHVDRLGTVGRMAAGIAHELGTPLNVIAGRAALIASGSLPAEEVTSSARTIKSEADRITNIVQRLLDFARQRPPQRSECQLAALVQRTVGLLESLAQKRQVHLECPLPSIDSRCSIDESQIQQVLTNLIVNAIQATPSQTTVRISVDQPDNGWLRVCVEDCGAGVPEHLRERIFEPFFTTKDVGEGTGLGLSIAFGIVQEHQGRLEVQRSELGGAAMELWLPTRKSKE